MRVASAYKWGLSDSDGIQLGQECLIVMISGDPVLGLSEPDLSSSGPALKQLDSNSAADAPLGKSQAFLLPKRNCLKHNFVTLVISCQAGSHNIPPTT